MKETWMSMKHKNKLFAQRIATFSYFSLIMWSPCCAFVAFSVFNLFNVLLLFKYQKKNPSPFIEARAWLGFFFQPGFALVFLCFQPSTTYAQRSSLEALCESEAPSCQCFWFSSANGANIHTGYRFQSTCPTQTSLCSTCYCWFVLPLPPSSPFIHN